MLLPCILPRLVLENRFWEEAQMFEKLPGILACRNGLVDACVWSRIRAKDQHVLAGDFRSAHF
ncbi:MAG: hypothetical protein B6I34_00715 [Anaerolineaceae bacterium 4572_32.1]|nr:MAG: hypothetical protein B6I34_00715 [Anaerolineaceae bacterium 4572_32.1]